MDRRQRRNISYQVVSSTIRPLEEQAWEWSKKHIGNGAALQIAVLMKSGKKPGAVGKYRLSKAAEEDLIGIALFGDEHFGIAQSNRYRDQLERQFSALA